MMDSWHTYPSIYAFGHRYLAELLLDPVVVQEKIDGSQISFGFFPADTGDLNYRIRSKGAELQILAPEKMFAPAVEVILGLSLHPGWTYRGEYLAKPKHNALAYDRTPTNHLILFDVNIGDSEFLDYTDKAYQAGLLGLEVVPRLFQGRIENVEQFRTFLDTVSVLGGQKIEGVVVKPVGYDFFGVDKKVLLGKFVSEAFREVHKQSWRTDNPTTGDVVALIAKSYTTPARWNKCVQHLRDDGRITGDSVKDIGPVMQEIPEDILAECREDIQAALFKAFWPEIARRIRQGFPEYYKEQLLKQQFETASENSVVG